MAKRSSKNPRRPTTKRPATKRPPAAKAAEAAGKYALGREIGRGGLGRVVEAVDAEIGRTVALKLLLDGAPLDLVERFKREGRITARLEHPNIVPVHEVGFLPATKQTRGEIFFAMKKIAGRDLADVLKEFRAGKGGWTLRRLVEVFRDVCRAMAFAHSRGVIHRDLKPSNVMVGEFGEVLVVDWGLAKETGRPETGVGRKTALNENAPLLTLDGDIFGTPDYMSPEQADGRIDLIDERSDVFSLGAVLYEILAGRPPFAGGTTTEILRRVIEGNPTRPTDLLKTLDPAARGASAAPPTPPSVSTAVPPELEAVCLRALSKDRAARHASAASLQSDVQSWLDGDLERERRQALADDSVGRARVRVAQWQELREKAEAAAERVAALEDAGKGWDDLEAKQPLWRLQDELEQLERRRAEAFAEADAELTSALTLIPSHAAAREERAGLFWRRFLELEESGDVAGQIAARRVVEHMNDGRLDAELRGDGTLSLATRAWGCACLREGRRVAPEELAVREHHPWSGRTPLFADPEIAADLEPAGPVRLRVHGAGCRPQELTGADVWAFRYAERGRLMIPETLRASERPVPSAVLDAIYGDSPFRPRGGGEWLGRTPLRRLPWTGGPALLVVAAEGFVPMAVPVALRRCEDLELKVTLFRPDEIPAGCRLVAEGPCVYQGDREVPFSARAEVRDLPAFFLARDPVTCAEYLEFLNDVAASDPARARRHAPRESEDSGWYWPEAEGKFVIPTAEWLATAPAAIRAQARRLRLAPADWRADWPVAGVSWLDGLAYARWLSARTGALFTLPMDDEWEKAARGPDQRPFPWGRHFEPRFANSNVSHASGMQPVPIDAFPTDESPYGHRGLGGNSTDPCLNIPGKKYLGWRCVRGGSWVRTKSLMRSTYRTVQKPANVFAASGIRLAAVVQLSAQALSGRTT